MKSKMLLSVYVVSLFLMLSGCSKKTGSVINDFYEAKTWEEKKAFILDAGGLKASDVYDEEAEYSVLEVLVEKKIDDNTSIYKITRMRKLSGKEEKQVRRWLITKVGDKEKIDFKTMIGFNEMGILEYCQSTPSEPKKFWVEVSLREKYYLDYAITDILKLQSTKGAGTIMVPIPSEGFSNDIAKLKEFAIKNKGGLVLVEISQKAEVYSGDYYKIKPEGIKFIKLNPLNEN